MYPKSYYYTHPVHSRQTSIDPIDQIDWTFVWPLDSVNGIDPSLGAGAATGSRASSKRQQATASTGTLLTTNEMEICQFFNGSAIEGLPLEAVGSNDLSAAHADSFSGWTLFGVAVGAKNQTDPFGQANEAQILTPSGGASSVLADVILTSCANRTVIFDVYLRTVTGSHNCDVGIAEFNGIEEFTETFNLTTDWQLCHIEATFGAGAGFTIPGIYVDTDGTDNPVIARLPCCRIDTNTLQTPCLTTFAAEEISTTALTGLRGDRGSFYFEVYPLRNVLNMGPAFFLYFEGITSTQASSYLKFQLGEADLLLMRIDNAVGGNSSVQGPVLNSGTFPRATVHKIALTWDASGFDIYLNGSRNANAVPAGVGTQTLHASASIKLSHVAAPAQSIITNVRGIGERLSQATCEEITT